MAVDNDAYLYNHLPNEKVIVPVDLFTGVSKPRYKLKYFHIWGALVYVLNHVLQREINHPGGNRDLEEECL